MVATLDSQRKNEKSEVLCPDDCQTGNFGNSGARARQGGGGGRIGGKMRMPQVLFPDAMHRTHDGGSCRARQERGEAGTGSPSPPPPNTGRRRPDVTGGARFPRRHYDRGADYSVRGSSKKPSASFRARESETKTPFLSGTGFPIIWNSDDPNSFDAKCYRTVNDNFWGVQLITVPSGVFPMKSDTEYPVPAGKAFAGNSYTFVWLRSPAAISRTNGALPSGTE